MLNKIVVQTLPNRIRVSTVKNHRLYTVEKYLKCCNSSTQNIIDDMICELLIKTME